MIKYLLLIGSFFVSIDLIGQSISLKTIYEESNWLVDRNTDNREETDFYTSFFIRKYICTINSSYIAILNSKDNKIFELIVNLL